MITVLNFSYPLTERHCTQIASMLNTTLDQITVLDHPIDFDTHASLVSQVEALASALTFPDGLLLVNPPSHSSIAVLLLVELRRRYRIVHMVCMRSVWHGTPPHFDLEVAEIVPLY